MADYVAHYRSPNGSAARAMGLFEFSSDARLNTKALAHDARMKMLEMYGKEAVAWQIDKIERRKARPSNSDGQLELDFRDPVAVPKRRRSRDVGKL